MQDVEFFEKGIGPKVVLFHSSASSAGQWKVLMDHFKDKFHFISVNLIGYGNTTAWNQNKVQTLLDQVKLLEKIPSLSGSRFSIVGHSFGGAVVIAAGANSSHIKGVVALSPQTYGAGMAPQLAPRRLLVVHGKADTRLTFACGQQIYDMAKEPKELVLYEGAEHRLEECRDDLEELLGNWIPETLAADIKLV